MKKNIVLFRDPMDISTLLGSNLEFVDAKEWIPEPDTNVLVIGTDAYKLVSSKVHLGLRGAMFPHLTKMPCVRVENNIALVFCYPPIKRRDKYKKEYRDYTNLTVGLSKLMDPEIDKELCPEPPKEVIVTNSVQARILLRELIKDDIPWFGYDYESSGLPHEAQFILTGLGLSFIDKSGVGKSYFFDYRLMDNLPDFLDALGEFLDWGSSRCIVFNVDFELRASYIYHGKYYEFKDLNIFNIVRVFGRFCNLKWSARHRLKVKSWDDLFDAFHENLPNCYLRDESKVLKGVDIDKFERITGITLSERDKYELTAFSKYRADGFYPIPSSFLANYCCKDTWYTLQSWLIELPNWKSDLIDVYTDGKLMESRINSQGMVKDVELFRSYVDINDRLLLLSGTVILKTYFKYKSEPYEDKNDINKYTPLNQVFIRAGINVNKDKSELAKQLLTGRYFNKNCEGWFDTNKVYEDFGNELGELFISKVRANTKTLEGVSRKRTIFKYVGELMKNWFPIESELLTKHSNTVNYHAYDNRKNAIDSVPWIGMSYHDYPSHFKVNNRNLPIKECIQYLLSFVNINSNDNKNLVYDGVFKEFLKYRLHLHMRSMGRAKHLKDLYVGDRKGDTDVFISNFGTLNESDVTRCKTCMDANASSTIYWFDKMLFVKTDLNTYGGREDFIKSIERGELKGDESDFARLVMYQKIWDKYFKSQSTYVEGQFKQFDSHYDSLDRLWVNRPTKEKDPMKVKSWAKYDANKQFSFR